MGEKPGCNAFWGDPERPQSEETVRPAMQDAGAASGGVMSGCHGSCHASSPPQPARIVQYGHRVNGRGLVVQLLRAVDDAGAELNAVARDEDQGLSLREQKFRLPLVLAVGLGLLKFQQSNFPLQLQEHGSNICHDVAVLLPRQLRDLVARHRERAFNEIRWCLIGLARPAHSPHQ